MGYEYRVDVDGETVWSDTSEEYEGTKFFPEEYRQVRPASGTVVELVLNGEVIGRQISQDDEDAEMAMHAEKTATEGDGQ
jgi:hypothetical protein